MADRTTKVTLTAQVSGYLSGMDRAAKATRDMTKDAKERLAEQQAAMEKIGGAALKMGTVSAVGLGLVAKSAIDWESAWTGVLKTVDGSPEQLAAIEDGLRSLAQELPATHQEIAAVAEAAGQLGVAADDVVEFTRTMVDLGETTNLTADEAATSIAQMMNVMQTAPEDVDRLGSALVALGNDGASTERDIILMAQRIAGAGKVIGLSEGEVLGFANALSSVGIEVEAGGSAISRIMIDIAKSVSAGGKDLEAFASVAGMSSKEFTAAFKSDPTDAIATFVEGLGKVNAAGGDVFATLSDLGQTDIRVTNALLGMSNSGDLLRESLELGNEAWAENVALQTEAEKRYATTEAQLQKTTGAINDAAISAGSVLLPAISDASEGVAEFAGFIADLPEPVLGVATGLTVMATGVALFGGGLLVLAPRIQATKLAMQDLNLTGKNLAKTIGKGGLLMAGIAAVTGGMANLNNVTDLTVDQVAALNAAFETGDLAEFTKQLRLGGAEGENLKGALEAMTGSDYYSWQRDVTQGTLNFAAGIPLVGEAFKGLASDMTKNEAVFAEYGKTLAAAAESDFPAVTDAFKAMQVEAGGTEEATKNLLETMPEYKAALIELAAAEGETLTEQELLNFAMGKGELAQKLSREAAARNADTLEDLAGVAADTEGAVEGLSDELRNFGQTTFDVIDAEQEFYLALDAVTARLGEDGFAKGLDQASEAGRANMDVLTDIAKSTNEFAAATYDSTGSVDELNAILADGRAALVETGKRFGLTEAQAEDYADQLLATPKSIESRVALSGVNGVLQQLNAIRVGAINARSAMSDLNGEVSGSGRMGTFASGGTVRGPGTSKSDSVPIMASVGEEIIQEPYASQYRDVLKRINAGTFQGYASGGTVGYAPQYATPQYASSSGPSNITRHGDTFQIYEAPDPVGTAQAVSRRQNMLGAV